MKTYTKDTYKARKQPNNGLFWAIMILLLSGISLEGCGAVKTIEKIEYREIINTRIDTVSVEIPKEVVKEVVPQFDTLIMETSIAKAKAYVDSSSNSLKGELIHKPVEIKKEIEIQEKVVYRDSIITQIKEIPIEVPVKHVPTALIVLSTIGMNALFLLLLWFLGKLKIFKV